MESEAIDKVIATNDWKVTGKCKKCGSKLFNGMCGGCLIEKENKEDRRKIMKETLRVKEEEILAEEAMKDRLKDKDTKIYRAMRS